MTELLDIVASNAASGAQIANLRKDFKMIDNHKFVEDSKNIVKAVCATVAGTDDTCADEAGYNERDSPKAKIKQLATDLLKDALSVDKVLLIKYLTEYQTEEEKQKSINANNNDNNDQGSSIGDESKNEICPCPTECVNESDKPVDNDSMIKQNAVAVAAASSEITSDIPSSDNTEIEQVAVAVVSASSDKDNGAMSGGIGKPINLPDRSSAALAGDALAGDLAGDALAGAALAGAIPTPGFSDIVSKGDKGDSNSEDAKEILKMYTTRMVSTIKCNNLVYEEIKTFLEQAYRFGKEEIKKDKLDIIKDSLKTHSDVGRKNMNQERIRIYKKNLEYIKNIDTREGIEAYIHIVDDMLPFLVLAHIHEDGDDPSEIIKQYVSKIKSKSIFKKVLENITFPNTLESEELISELGFTPTTEKNKKKNSNINDGNRPFGFNDLMSAAFAGAGKQTRKKRTRKYKKPINNRTR